MSRTAAVLLLCLAVFGPLRGQQAMHLENGALRAEFRPATGSLLVLDKHTGKVWELRPPKIVLQDRSTAEVRPGDGSVRRAGNSIRYNSIAGTTFELSLVASPPAIDYSCRPGPGVAEVWPINESLRVDAGDANYFAVPRRMGLLIPPEGPMPVTRRFQGYGDSGYTMAMLGAVNQGSCLLVSWSDPYADIIIEYFPEPRRGLTASLAFVFDGVAKDGFIVPPSRLLTAGRAPHDQRTVRLEPLGRGGYVQVARAYRAVAQRKGYLKTLAEKLRENPPAERLFGAADFKVFTFSRTVPNTRWNPTDKERVSVNYTFEQCAELAEHLRNDLGLDRALLVVNGWNRRGYDNQHPDVLPAAAEAGGNEGLAACSRRVKALGWLFGMHDNYQNLYKDAPSWDEAYIMRKADGSLFQRGVWAGGAAYIICQRRQMEFARRNMPEIHRLFGPTAFFSDQVLAAPLYECFDARHPMTRSDDIREKIELAEYIRSQFGVFGTEDGQEWAVPHTDYFEGLMAHKTGYRQPQRTEIVIPLVELVYGDAVPIYTHQSDRAKPDNPAWILDHLLYAEMPVYFFGRPGYWRDPERSFRPPDGARSRLVFAQNGRHNLIDGFIKNTYEVLSPLNRATAMLPMTDHRFLTPDRKVEATRFGEDVEIIVNYGADDYTAKAAVLPQYGFLIESPELVAFHARSYRGATYDEPSLFVISSRDGRPLSTSRRIRVYRAFGERRLRWASRSIEVDTEKIIGRDSQ